MLDLALAYRWCCRARQHFPPCADIWQVRERWEHIRPKLEKQLANGTFCFSPMQRFRGGEDGSLAIWSSIDAIVLKSISMYLTVELANKLSYSCVHSKGHGGVPGAIAILRRLMPIREYFFRSDIASFYSSIDHDTLITQLRSLIQDTGIFALVEQSISRCEEYGGVIYNVKQGIPLGSPLPPLLAAIYLLPMDKLMERENVGYVRFMDDWVILTASKAKMFAVLRKMTELLVNLKVRMHRGKTKYGRIRKGFDFLGFHFSSIFFRCQPSRSSVLMLIAKYCYYLTFDNLLRANNYLRCFLAYLTGCRCPISRELRIRLIQHLC